VLLGVHRDLEAAAQVATVQRDHALERARSRAEVLVAQ
jgi:hypothetical protein